jgi:hypothetical protein
MDLHRRVLGALSPLLLAGVFVVGFVVSTDVSRGAGTSDADVQVIFVSGLSNLRGWKPDRARARVIRRGDAAALVTATRRHGVFALALRPGPPAKTVAEDEYTASAKVKTRRATSLVCLYLRDQNDGQTVGRVAACRVVGRRWTTLSTSPYPALEDGNRFVLDIFTVARGGTTARRSFLVSSAKITRRCKSTKTAAGCGASSGGTSTGTSSGGGTTTAPGTTSGTTSVATTTTPEPAPPATMEGGAIDAPASGVLFGATLVGADASDVPAWETKVGKKIAIRQRFSRMFSSTGAPQDLLNVEPQCAAGEIPELSWTAPGASGTMVLEDINAGNLDAYFHAQAQRAKGFSCDIFIRFLHEMNGDWYGYGRKPAAYRLAFQRVVTIFDEEGAGSDVSFVWAPAIPQGNYASYYPGDAAVDWIGFDVYNRGTCQSPTRWQSFRDMLHWSLTGEDFYAWAAAKGKPMYASETGSAEQAPAGSNPPDKPTWVRQFLLGLKSHPAIHAWNQEEYVDANGTCNWRVDSSAATLAAFKEILADPYFLAAP